MPNFISLDGVLDRDIFTDTRHTAWVVINHQRTYYDSSTDSRRWREPVLAGMRVYGQVLENIRERIEIGDLVTMCGQVAIPDSYGPDVDVQIVGGSISVDARPRPAAKT